MKKHKNRMKKKRALTYFGSVKRLAKALDITREAVYQWGDYVPELSTYKIKEIMEREELK